MDNEELININMYQLLTTGVSFGNSYKIITV